MLLRVPEFYDCFQCTAASCPDNCCIGWEIDIDPESDLRYRQVTGAFGAQLRDAINREGESPCFRLKGERCALLNGENLCELILHTGEGALCQICRDHPRFTDTFGELRETGLGLCCPEAARLLLSNPKKLAFTLREIPETGDREECDPRQVKLLLEVRTELFRIVQDRDCPLTKRMEKLLELGERTQGVEREAEHPDRSVIRELAMWLDTLAELEAINQEWTETLTYTRNVLACPEDKLLSLWSDFRAAAAIWQHEYEHLLMYFLFRYFLKSVYTGDVLTPIQLAVVSCLLVGALELARFAEQYSLAPEERIALAGLYSKQVEYSEENLAALEDRLITEQSFSCRAIREILKGIGNRD